MDRDTSRSSMILGMVGCAEERHKSQYQIQSGQTDGCRR
jgi:hypothetical protein